MKQRLIHIDIAKAIGLIIIMTSHINVHPSLREMTSMKLYQDIIHSFYVPLFFILSGIFLKPPQYKLFSINGLCFFNLLVKDLVYTLILFYLMSVPLYYIINGKWTYSFIVNVPLWFLIVLIIDKILFSLILYAKNWIQIILISILGFTGCICGQQGHSYMYLATSGTCLPFIAFGYYFRHVLMKSNFDISLISFSFTIWCLCFTLFFKPVELWLNNIQQNLLTMYISAIAGSIALIELCKLIKCSWLSTFGINSIIPMCTHVPILYVIQICFYPNNWIEWFCLNIFLFFVSYSTIYIFKNKYYNLIKFPY